MKFIHLSDLHIGKKVNGFSMLDDQKYILKEIIQIIQNEKPDAILIAGDIYDKSVPSTDAVEVLDDFIFNLSQMSAEVFIISGNHDSAERLAFGSRIIDKSGIHISPVYDGKVNPFTLNDSFGDLNIYMLPFIKPANVRIFFDDEIKTYTDAMSVAIENMNVDTTKRNILITHQFVTGSSRTESEDISIGGTDNIDVSVFDVFDYVALGHIHRPQNCSSSKIRYCGTPLKYSFSEAEDKKSVTIVEINQKNTLNIKEIYLSNLHNMVELKGTYNELSLKSFYDGTSYQTDYVHITLTDEEDIPNAVEKLRTIYQNLMRLDYDNERTKTNQQINGATNTDMETKSPLELFDDFYKLQNGRELNIEEKNFLTEIIQEIWEAEK